MLKIKLIIMLVFLGLAFTSCKEKPKTKKEIQMEIQLKAIESTGPNFNEEEYDKHNNN
mgnify:FL=1